MIELVYYKQQYPVDRVWTGYLYRKRRYVIPMSKNFDQTSDGRLLPKRTRMEWFALIYNPDHPDPFKQNIQRPIQEVKRTGIMLTESEFKGNFGVTPRKLYEEWRHE